MKQNSHEIKCNNFDITRIVLALIVVFAHLAVLTQDKNLLSYGYLFNSNFAVKGFFTISGFLVTKSFINSDNLVIFAKKRLYRIYPAYAVSVLSCVAIGAIVNRNELLHFISSLTTIKYIIFNALFLNFIQPTLPNVFTSNAIHALNGSLWTIKIELLLYALLPLLVHTFRQYNKFVIIGLIIFIGIAWEYFFTAIYKGARAEILVSQLPAQLPYFALGVFYYMTPKYFNYSKWAAIIFFPILIITNNSLIQLAIKPIAFSSVIIFICTDLPIKFRTDKIGDISYGIYVFHFPIIQYLVSLNIFKQNLLLGLTVCLPSILFTSLISWNFIEKRFIKRNNSALAI